MSLEVLSIFLQQIGKPESSPCGAVSFLLTVVDDGRMHRLTCFSCKDMIYG